jgi:hypothetical protein
MYPDEKTHNQIDNIMIDRSRHSSILDVRSFMAAESDCDTDHYLVVVKVRDKLAVNKETLHRLFHLEGFNFKISNEVEGNEKYHINISNRFTAVKHWKLRWVLIMLGKLLERISEF